MYHGAAMFAVSLAVPFPPFATVDGATLTETVTGFCAKTATDPSKTSADARMIWNDLNKIHLCHIKANIFDARIRKIADRPKFDAVCAVFLFPPKTFH